MPARWGIGYLFTAMNKYTTKLTLVKILGRCHHKDTKHPRATSRFRIRSAFLFLSGRLEPPMDVGFRRSDEGRLIATLHELDAAKAWIRKMQAELGNAVSALASNGGAPACL